MTERPRRSYLRGGTDAHRASGDLYPDSYGVVAQPAPTELKLPDLDAEEIAFTVMDELDQGWKRLRREYRSATGSELSAVHQKVLRFRDETLAGLLAGPHLPLAEDHLVESVREAAADVLRQVEALLSGR